MLLCPTRMWKCLNWCMHLSVCERWNLSQRRVVQLQLWRICMECIEEEEKNPNAMNSNHRINKHTPQTMTIYTVDCTLASIIMLKQVLFLPWQIIKAIPNYANALLFSYSSYNCCINSHFFNSQHTRALNERMTWTTFALVGRFFFLFFVFVSLNHKICIALTLYSFLNCNYANTKTSFDFVSAC